MDDWWSWVDDAASAARLRRELAASTSKARRVLGVDDPLAVVDDANSLADLILSMDEASRVASHEVLAELASVLDARASNYRTGRYRTRNYPVQHLVAIGTGTPLRRPPWDGVAVWRGFPRNAPPRVAEVLAARPPKVQAAWLKRLVPFEDEGPEWELTRAFELAGLTSPEHDADYWRGAWTSLLPTHWDLESAEVAARERLGADPEVTVGMAIALEDPRVADVLTMFFGSRMIDVFATWARDGLLPAETLVASAIAGIAVGQRPGTARGLRRLANGVGISDAVVASSVEALVRIVDHAAPSEQKWAIDLLVRGAKAGTVIDPGRATRVLCAAIESGTATSGKAAWHAATALGADAVPVAIAALANRAAAVQEIGIRGLEQSTPLPATATAALAAVRDSLEPRVRARADALLGVRTPEVKRPAAPGPTRAHPPVRDRRPAPPLNSADDIVDALLLWHEDPADAVHAHVFAAALGTIPGQGVSPSHRKRLERTLKRLHDDPWERLGFAAVAELVGVWAGLGAPSRRTLADLGAKAGPARSPFVKDGDHHAATALLATLIAESVEAVLTGGREPGAVHLLVESAATLKAPRVTGWEFTAPPERYLHIGVHPTIEGPKAKRSRPACTDLPATVAAWAAGGLTWTSVFMEGRGILDFLVDPDSLHWLLPLLPTYADVFAAEAACALMCDPDQDSQSRTEYLVVATLVAEDGPVGLGAAALIAAGAASAIPAARAALVDAMVLRGTGLPLAQAGLVLADAVSAGLGGLSRVAALVRNLAAEGAAASARVVLEAAVPRLPGSHRDLSVLFEAWEVACDADGVGVADEAARQALEAATRGTSKRAAAAKRLLSMGAS